MARAAGHWTLLSTMATSPVPSSRAVSRRGLAPLSTTNSLPESGSMTMSVGRSSSPGPRMGAMVPLSMFTADTVAVASSILGRIKEKLYKKQTRHQNHCLRKKKTRRFCDLLKS